MRSPWILADHGATGESLTQTQWPAGPPSSYTTPLKAMQITEYGYTDTAAADYEEDHITRR